PRLAELAGTRTWTFTRRRLQPLQQPLGSQRDRPRVQQDVLVGDDEDADDDEQHAGPALDGRNERAVALEELEDRPERDRREQEWQPQAGRVGDEQPDAPRHRLGGAGERENRTQDRPHTGRPPDREGDADQQRAQIAGGLLADLPLRRATEEA